MRLKGVWWYSDLNLISGSAPLAAGGLLRLNSRRPSRFMPLASGFHSPVKRSRRGWVQVTVASLFLNHLHRRRGFKAITGVGVFHHGCATPQAFIHVATSHTSSPITTIAPQLVSATVKHAGDSSFFLAAARLHQIHRTPLNATINWRHGLLLETCSQMLWIKNKGNTKC
jgi:hypothetical protein